MYVRTNCTVVYVAPTSKKKKEKRRKTRTDIAKWTSKSSSTPKKTPGHKGFRACGAAKCHRPKLVQPFLHHGWGTTGGGVLQNFRDFVFNFFRILPSEFCQKSWPKCSVHDLKGLVTLATSGFFSKKWVAKLPAQVGLKLLVIKQKKYHFFREKIQVPLNSC